METGAVGGGLGPQAPPAGRGPARGWMVGLLVAGLVIRLAAAWAAPGIVHPDEHQQYVEQSYRLVHGYGARFWEQQYGMRHPLFTMLLGGVLWLGERCGVADPHVLAALQRAALAAASYAAMAWLAWSLLGRGRTAAGLALAVMLVGCVDLVFIQTRVLSENGAVGALALALVFWPDRPLRAGLALGLMVAVRLQTAPLAAAFLAWSFWTALRPSSQVAWRGPAWRPLVAGLAVSITLMGWMDYACYGSWFHSAWVSVEKEWVEHGANTFGTKPWCHLIVQGGCALLRLSPLAFGFLGWGACRRPDLACALLAFVAAHSLIGHKEVRFLWPLAPAVCLLLAAGFEGVLACRPRWRRQLIAWAAASMLLPSGVRAWLIGWRTEPYVTSCRLLAEVGRRNDVRGVVLCDIPRWSAGNYFYLRRPVPVRYCTRGECEDLARDPAWRSGMLNYVVLPPGGGESVPGVPLRRVSGWRGWTIYERDDAPPAAGRGRGAPGVLTVRGPAGR